MKDLLELNSNKYLNKEYSKNLYIDEMYAIHQLLFNYSKYISKTDINKIEILDHEVVMCFRNSGIKMYCIEGDKRIACLDALNFKNYEQEELEMQYSLISKDDAIIDIGGNYGWYALHLSKKFPSSTIHSFEPIPKTYETFLRNIKLNNSSNIIVNNFGLSETSGNFSFFFDPNLSVNASLNNVSESKNAVEIKCNVETLDSYVLLNGITKIDFIKCDIEGAELFALKGALNSINKFKPKLFVEMLRKWTSKFNYKPDDIILFLKDIGYMCFKIQNEKLIEIKNVTDETIETNFIFLHREYHKDLILKFSK